jgi:hypothetical protein
MLKDSNRNKSEELIDEALQKPPRFSLSDNFADLVAQKATRHFAWQQYFKEFLIYFGVFAGILAVAGGMAFLFLESSWEAWINFITSNVFLVAGIVFVALFILFADKVLLRYFFYRYTDDKTIKS